jgi:hypothetical protein
LIPYEAKGLLLAENPELRQADQASLRVSGVYPWGALPDALPVDPMRD